MGLREKTAFPDQHLLALVHAGAAASLSRCRAKKWSSATVFECNCCIGPYRGLNGPKAVDGRF
jgi:hypothetical protein